MAAVFRWTALDWDDYRHFHPDERYISWVATSIERPLTLTTALSPHESTFNPYYWPADAESPGVVLLQDEQRAFAYGHLPLYLGVIATRFFERSAPNLIPHLPIDWLFTRDILNLVERSEYGHITAVSRALTGLFDIGTVLLTFILGRRLYGTAVGLLSAAFLAFNVMHIQLAHFFISDPYLTFFIVASILCWVEAFKQYPRYSNPLSAERQKRRAALWVWAGCIMTGLAIGSKFAAIIMMLPLFIVVWAMWPKGWIWRLLVGGLIVFLTFFVTNPFAVIDLSCEVITPAVSAGPVTFPSVNWRSCYLDNIFTQRNMVSGESDLPFTRQYSGTTPFLYFVEMQIKWGMGPLLGIVAFLGFGWVLWQHGAVGVAWLKKARIRRVAVGKRPSLRQLILENPALLLLAWCVPYFASTGSFYVKFMRYLQPMVPFLMIFGAVLLWEWKRPFFRAFSITMVLVTTAVFALAFVNMYQLPHPWLVASGWFYANAPEDVLILSEKWDDSLPTSMVINGNNRRSSEFTNLELGWITNPDGADNVEKLRLNLALMSQAKYVTVVSNRGYGVVPRLPERYPISSQYYQLLFYGKLGYEPVFVFERTPNFAGWSLQPDTFSEPNLTPPDLVQGYLDSKRAIQWGKADESFTVYDQPLTIIFENKNQLSVDELMALFEIE